MQNLKSTVPTVGLVSFLLMTATGSIGCASRPAAQPATMAERDMIVESPTAWTSSDLVFQYRQQARDFRAMARRLDTEAEFYDENQDYEEAKRHRELAQKMRVAAEDADERAREYRSRLPHNQVY